MLFSYLYDFEILGKNTPTSSYLSKKQCMSLYVFLDNDLLINRMCNSAKRGGNRFLAAENLVKEQIFDYHFDYQMSVKNTACPLAGFR